MVKSERDADAKVPRKAINNTNINAMITPIASNIPPSPVNIMANEIYITDVGIHLPVIIVPLPVRRLIYY